MEKIYTAYIRKVDGTSFYFVKILMAFPELTNIAPILERLGMHTDFDKACEIARVEEAMKPILRQQLEDSMQQARVIDLSEANSLRQKSVGF